MAECVRVCLFCFLVPNATWCLKVAKVPEEAPGPGSLKDKSSWRENKPPVSQVHSDIPSQLPMTDRRLALNKLWTESHCDWVPLGMEPGNQV